MNTPALTGLPPIDTSREPLSVRNGSPAVQKAYAGALQFENLLMQQLSQSLVESSGLSGEGLGGADGESEGGGAGGDPVSTQLSSLLPQTLANGIMSQGGLGLATQLMSSIDPAAFAGAGAGAGTAAGEFVTAAGGSRASASVGPASAQIDPSGGVSA